MLSWTEGKGQNFNYPYGMGDWCFHAVLPVVEPEKERRSFLPVVWELFDRMGMRAILNKSMNDFFDFDEEHALKPDEIFTEESLADRSLKFWFGENCGLDYFREHGFVKWGKKVEEAYWRYFVDCRVPIYLEFLIDMKEKMKVITDRIGLDVDYTQYTPCISWTPCSIHKVDDPEYDLYCFSYRDVLHTGSATMEQPWIDEASMMNPYTYHICMNEDTATAKGLKSGDSIVVETVTGRRVTGTLKTMQGQHPQTCSIAACAGHWAKGMPIAKGKGTNFDNLLEIDLKHSDQLSLNLETAVRVRVIKI